MSASVPFFHPASLIVTFLGIGRIPFAPGTFGSLAGVGIVVGLYGGLASLDISSLSGIISVLIYFLAFLLASAGLLATSSYLDITKKEDPGEIVIDEVVGQLLAIAFCFPFIYLCANEIPLSRYFLVSFTIFLLIPFFTFRFFDIVKIGPVKWADNLEGTAGVLLDDIFAGIMAGFLSIALLYGIFIFYV